MKAVGIAIVALPLLVACSSTQDRVVDEMADALVDGRYDEAWTLADSLTADRANCSVENLADVAVAWVMLNNEAVKTDSIEAGEVAMNSFRTVYSTMVERDSSEAVEQIEKIRRKNPQLSLTAIDSMYEATLQQVETLRRVSARLPLK